MDASELVQRGFASTTLDKEQIDHIENRIVNFLSGEGITRVIPTSEDIYMPSTLKKHRTSLRLPS